MLCKHPLYQRKAQYVVQTLHSSFSTTMENIYLAMREEAHPIVVIETGEQQCEEINTLIQGLRIQNAILKEHVETKETLEKIKMKHQTM